eukprot:CAMPEP_0178387590 /NCGR_PEP_ID=MMETSP0689_2-20121128/9152_1 /TAXON_ID=160604 /ORGANISM="Amphidinium massartii, Strain CS-259" /LENGTH=188 /DNA_ID=CAMNT_0020007959 /DNA_START=663 /DNA_END=1229 /DNA_ORIENTATION=+
MPTCSVDLSHALDYFLHSTIWERCASKFCIGPFVLLALIFCVLGPVLFVVTATLLWLKRMLQRLLQLIELKALTKEYAVVDLADYHAQRSCSSNSDEKSERPFQQHNVKVLEGSDLSSDQDCSAIVQQSLARDLLAVFGDRYSAVAPPLVQVRAKPDEAGAPMVHSSVQLVRSYSQCSFYVGLDASAV